MKEWYKCLSLWILYPDNLANKVNSIVSIMGKKSFHTSFPHIVTKMINVVFVSQDSQKKTYLKNTEEASKSVHLN